jgi:hypothetical protein
VIRGQNAIEVLISDHSRYAWDDLAFELVSKLPITTIEGRRAGEVKSGLCIPTDIPFDPGRSPVKADCFGVSLVQLHPFDRSSFPDFVPVPDLPWLWRNRHGAFMLAFNLSGYVERFIGFGEEREITERDHHGRLHPDASTLGQLGMLHEPILNKYLFAVLAVAKGHGTKSAALDPSDHVLPPALVLSHDCDQLRGDDAITQAVRIYRFFAPLKRLRPPAWGNLRHVLENALYPRKYYFDDARAMSDIEHQYGFRSIFYFLNGMGGRLGARSGSSIIRDFSQRLPSTAEFGVHYNYRYVFDQEKLAGQIRELEALTGRHIKAGRAHYLIIDPNESFGVLSELGIHTDESLGFSQQNAFRLGFAGAFRTSRGLPVGSRDVVEIPMHFMDENTAPRDDAFDLRRMVAEVEKVGGIVTLLFHPGAFHSPEAPKLRGVYQSHLSYFRHRRYRSMLPSEISTLLEPEQARHPTQ